MYICYEIEIILEYIYVNSCYHLIQHLSCTVPQNMKGKVHKGTIVLVICMDAKVCSQ
jgi:hypothetical protein